MKRIIPLILALLMLVSCLLVSCKKNEEKGDDTSVATSNADDDSKEESKYLDELPEKDMGGYEFTVLTASRSDYIADTNFANESDGSIYGEAIHRRNVSVADRFNCNLVMRAEASDETLAGLMYEIMSGDCGFDMAMLSPVGNSNYVLEGYFLDWSKENMPYVDTTKPYYNERMNAALTVADSQYYLAGDFANSITRFTYCWYFNMTLLRDVHHMDPDALYELVANKQWTLETAYQMIEKTASDEGTLGEKDTEDTFGYVSNYYSASVAYNYAFNNPTMVMVDGYPQLNENFYEKSVDIIESVRNLFYDNRGSYVGDWGAEYTSWSSGKALVVVSVFHDALTWNDFKFNFGIVPYPMYDASQNEYYSMVDGAHGLMVLPGTMPKEHMENNSIIIEALNSESARISKPVFLDQTLKLRTFNESIDKASEVIDIISTSVVADFGYLFSNQIEGFPFMIQYVMKSQNEAAENRVDFSSLYEQYEDKNIGTYNSIISRLISLSEGE